MALEFKRNKLNVKDGNGNFVEIPVLGEQETEKATAGELAIEVSRATAAEEALSAQVNRLQKVVGSPFVANTAASMTNTDRVYVYTGSESGYTAGNWYYYDGSAWVSGGVYNSAGMNTDTTLEMAGIPADAEATGEAVANLSRQLSDLNEAVEIEPFGVNLYDPNDPDVLRGKYYDGNTLKTAASLGQSGYIPVEVFRYYTSNQRDVFVQLYDSEKTFVQKVTSDDFARFGYVVIPAGIAYARFIFLTASESTFKIWETNASGADSPTVPYLKQEDIGAAGINLRFLAGAVRKSSADSDWGLINDSGHVPLNLTSVSVDASGNLVVMYSFTAKRVIALEVTPDETFANSYVAGASVGLDRATITFYSTQTRTKVNANDIYNAYGNFWIFGVMDA